jgi:hypothetical protein
MHCAVLAVPHKCEIELLLAHVLANTDTKDTQSDSESDSDPKSLDHMCDSNLSSSTGSEKATHKAMYLVLHVSDSEIGIGDLNLEDSIAEYDQDNALDEDEIVVAWPAAGTIAIIAKQVCINYARSSLA